MKLRILGIRGVPAAHGGFETFAEYLCLYLVQQGWKPVVYCQEDGEGEMWTDEWKGVERIHIPVKQSGPLGTIIFDWKTNLHAMKYSDQCLILGYNTAIFTLLLRFKGIHSVINMDGIEWSRAKWGPIAKLWFWFNDWAGCWLGNHLVADHPEIKKHLSTRANPKKITMIPYGAEEVTHISVEPLAKWSLEKNGYLTVIARPEPENSLLEIVEGFSKSTRGIKLVVLGNYDRSNTFHKKVLDAASDEVLFIGAIYDKAIVQALRYYSLAYVHGHQVGGTNPSLVEALGAGNAIIAHDNRFNKWVAGKGAMYFSNADAFSLILDKLIDNPNSINQMKHDARERFIKEFTWPNVLNQYEDLLKKYK
ncbi:DUF1972 domain-containing protein [Acinetobacter sp. YH12142]|uniref:DUF1972 domain-containing protein n=1 Tax=Acinetobacter sp. YH12142 TaxID=2601126 RepID=UPI0015D25B08|nr:DUF1972 domain-containing protein [Acinetobacter sp. YH12142]